MLNGSKAAIKCIAGGDKKTDGLEINPTPQEIKAGPKRGSTLPNTGVRKPRLVHPAVGIVANRPDATQTYRAFAEAAEPQLRKTAVFGKNVATDARC